MKTRHQPERTCLGCGTRDNKKGLARFIATAVGELRIDKIGEGRGGYLHKSAKCYEGFLQKRKTYRAFRREISLLTKERLIRELRDQSRE